MARKLSCLINNSLQMSRNSGEMRDGILLGGVGFIGGGFVFIPIMSVQNFTLLVQVLYSSCLSGNIQVYLYKLIWDGILK